VSETTAERLQISKVIELTLAAIRSNISTLAPVALLFVALPEALSGLVVQSDTNAVFSITLLTQCVLQAAAAFVVAGEMNGQRLGFSQALNKTGSVFLPILGISILATLGVIAGTLLLVIPGVILACMWAVAVPVRALEEPGVRRAFGRSRALTKDYRGHILLMVLILLIPLIVLGLLGGLVTLGNEAALNIVVMPLITAAVSLLTSVGAAALYVELRRIKEGGGATSVAEVFA
jgi:hypothetical protein